MENGSAPAQLLLMLNPTSATARKAFADKFNFCRYDPGSFRPLANEALACDAGALIPLPPSKPQKPCIYIRLDQPPKNMADGFVFGNNKLIGDVFVDFVDDAEGGNKERMFSVNLTPVSMKPDQPI